VVDIEGDKVRNGGDVGWNATGRDVGKHSSKWRTPPMSKTGSFLRPLTCLSRWTLLQAMDVPFLSSGALSRAHYTLVRQVENAASLQAVDDVLLVQVASIRKQFAGRPLSMVCAPSLCPPNSQPDRCLARIQRMSNCPTVLRYDFDWFSPGSELRTTSCHKSG